MVYSMMEKRKLSEREIIDGYLKLIKHHEKYIEEYKNRIKELEVFRDNLNQRSI